MVMSTPTRKMTIVAVLCEQRKQQKVEERMGEK